MQLTIFLMNKEMNFSYLWVPRIRLRVTLMCSVRLRIVMQVTICAMCALYILCDCTPWSCTTRGTVALQTVGNQLHINVSANSLALEDRRHLFKRCHMWKRNESTCHRSELDVIMPWGPNDISTWISSRVWYEIKD